MGKSQIGLPNAEQLAGAAGKRSLPVTAIAAIALINALAANRERIQPCRAAMVLGLVQHEDHAKHALGGDSSSSRGGGGGEQTATQHWQQHKGQWRKGTKGNWGRRGRRIGK